MPRAEFEPAIFSITSRLSRVQTQPEVGNFSSFKLIEAASTNYLTRRRMFYFICLKSRRALCARLSRREAAGGFEFLIVYECLSLGNNKSLTARCTFADNDRFGNLWNVSLISLYFIQNSFFCTLCHRMAYESIARLMYCGVFETSRC